MTKVEIASAKMAEHKMNCAQSVFSTYAEDCGLPMETALRIAQGFGGGMGRMGSVCGAITASYMILGLKQQMDAADPRKSLDTVYKLMKELNNQFLALHGSIMCKDMLGYNPGNPVEAEQARKNNVFATRCPKFVHDAVTILETLI